MIIAQHGINSLKSDDAEYVTIGGYKYKVVKIGNQKWIAENLRLEVGTYIYYHFDKSQYEYMGCYYNLDNLTPVQNALPDGWRIPTKIDFETLIASVGGSSNGGYKLKSTTDWLRNNGDNSSGFDGRPYQRYGPTDYGGNDWGDPPDFGRMARFASQTEIYDGSNYKHYYLNLTRDNNSAEIYTHFNSFYLNIRLVKDSA